MNDPAIAGVHRLAARGSWIGEVSESPKEPRGAHSVAERRLQARANSAAWLSRVPPTVARSELALLTPIDSEASQVVANTAGDRGEPVTTI